MRSIYWYQVIGFNCLYAYTKQDVSKFPCYHLPLWTKSAHCSHSLELNLSIFAGNITVSDANRIWVTPHCSGNGWHILSDLLTLLTPLKKGMGYFFYAVQGKDLRETLGECLDLLSFLLCRHSFFLHQPGVMIHRGKWTWWHSVCCELLWAPSNTQGGTGSVGLCSHSILVLWAEAHSSLGRTILRQQKISGFLLDQKHDSFRRIKQVSAFWWVPYTDQQASWMSHPRRHSRQCVLWFYSFIDYPLS